mmetsp:Transcript_20687/g.40186  ORF Transcript_20687/g.40186 Transcript_20687/m.40186 type:complete len:91 (+) Transcript_20687:1391-1663(+)
MLASAHAQNWVLWSCILLRKSCECLLRKFLQYAHVEKIKSKDTYLLPHMAESMLSEKRRGFRRMTMALQVKSMHPPTRSWHYGMMLGNAT